MFQHLGPAAEKALSPNRNRDNLLLIHALIINDVTTKQIHILDDNRKVSCLISEALETAIVFVMVIVMTIISMAWSVGNFL